MILLHRGHEHSGRFDDLVTQLDLPETAVFAHDARGHGRSPGERGYAPTFAALVKDVETLARHVSAAHGIPISEMVVLGHSVGAVVAASWVHDYAPPVRGMVLATPALRVRLYVPLAMPALRAREALSRKRRPSSNRQSTIVDPTCFPSETFAFTFPCAPAYCASSPAR